MNISFNAVQNVILVFPDERPIFMREVNNNMYDVGPYFCAKILSELPVGIVTPVLFGTVAYWALGLNPDITHFFLMLLTFTLSYNAAGSYSILLGACISNRELAVAITPVLIIPFMLFGGFFVTPSQIPWFMREFEYLSIFKYGYQAAMRTEFENNPHFPCAEIDGPNNYTSCGRDNNPLDTVTQQTAASALGVLTGLYALCLVGAAVVLNSLKKNYD